jgi:imidazolonepropionase-like amidohydrolase
MITTSQYKHAMVADKKTAMEEAALPIALKNIKKVYDAGIPVALGTDSGCWCAPG